MSEFAPAPALPYARCSRGRLITVALASTLLAAAGAAPASAVNADHGTTVVSANPANVTPHVMNGSVNALTQIGNKIIAAGTFTSVSPAGTFANTGRRRGAQPDLRLRRHHRGDRPDLQPEPRRCRQLARHRRHLDLRRRVVRLRRRQHHDQAGRQAERGRRRPVPRARPCPTRAVNEVVVRGRPGLRRRRRSPASSPAPSPPPAARWPRSTRPPAPCWPRSTCRSPASTTRRLGGATNIKRFDVTADGTPAGRGRQLLHRRRAAARRSWRWSTPAAAPPPSRRWATNRLRPRPQRLRGRLRHLHARRRLLPDGSYFVGHDDRRLRRRRRQRHAVRHRRPAGRPPAPATTRPGSTTPAATRPTASPSPAPPSTSAGTCAGRTTPSRATRPVRVPCPARASPRSTRSTACRCRGTPAGRAASARRRCSPPPQGLWVGSDTTRIGGETHGRIAFIPLAGGTAVPTVAAAHAAQRPLPRRSAPPARSSNVLYRVERRRDRRLQAGDGGPDWTDRRRACVERRQHGRLGQHASRRDGTVPAGTPRGIFATERWGVTQDWDFPVAAGTPRHGPAVLRQPVRLHRRRRAARLRRRHRRRDQAATTSTSSAAAGDKTGHDAVVRRHQRRHASTSTSAPSSRTRWSTASRSSTRRPAGTAGHAGTLLQRAASTPPALRRLPRRPRTPRWTGRPSVARSCSTARCTTA